MNYWWSLAFISGLGLASRNVLFKAVNTKLDVAFAAFMLSVGMVLASGIYYGIQKSVAQEPFIPSSLPLWPLVICLIAGIGNAVGNIFLALAYKQGGYAGLVAILQYSTAITVTLVIGYLFMSEVIKPMQLAGIVLAFAGVGLIIKG